MITSINNAQSVNASKSKIAGQGKRVAVPVKEDFKYVLENAKKGNEMAAVLLDEWQRSCKPKDIKEEQILKSINKAVSIIFR